MISEYDLERDQYAALMVAEFDARRRGEGPVEIVSCPERDERQEPAVELVLQTGSGGLIAVEHTRMQSFLDQTSERHALRAMFPYGGPELVDVPNAGDYFLVLRVGQLLGVGRRRRDRVAAEITSWTRNNLHRAPWPHTPGRSVVYQGVSDGGLELALERRTISEHVDLVSPRPVVPIVFWLPEDLERRRAVSLQRSVDRKVPKLLAAASGARTILVLENRDMSASAPRFVADALASADAPELPDAIYELDVCHGNPLLSGIFLDGVWWAELALMNETFPENRYLRFNAMPDR